MLKLDEPVPLMMPFGGAFTATSVAFPFLSNLFSRSPSLTLQKEAARFLTTLGFKHGGTALQTRQSAIKQFRWLLKPPFSSTILGLLLTSVSTRGSLPFLFLEGVEGEQEDCLASMPRQGGSI